MKLNKYFSLSAMTLSAAVLSVAVIVACTASSQAKPKPNFVTKEAPKPGVVAKINGEEITEEQLVGGDKMDFFELDKRRYELKMDKLNRMVEQKLIGAEAKKAGMSTEEFTDKKIVGGDTKVSDKELNAFIKDKHIPESQINPQIKERITAYLQSQKRQDKVQAYLAKLTKSSPVEVYFEKPKMVVEVDPGTDSPKFGSEKAKVKIVEFSDFQCPFCGRAADTVNELKKKYGSKIELAFRNFPLPNHPNARPSAEAAMCVKEQGTDKFWKYHDLLFHNQDKLDTPNLQEFAKKAGADDKKWKECVDAKKYADLVQKDTDYGEKVGVRSTPSFFINGQLLSGALPIENFSEVIDEELASAK